MESGASDFVSLIAKIPRSVFYGWMGVLLGVSLSGIVARWSSPPAGKAAYFVLYFLTSFFVYSYIARFTKRRKLLAIATVAISSAIGAAFGYAQLALYPRIFMVEYINFSCLGAIIFGIVVIPKKPLKIYGRKV